MDLKLSWKCFVCSVSGYGSSDIEWIVLKGWCTRIVMRPDIKDDSSDWYVILWNFGLGLEVLCCVYSCSFGSGYLIPNVLLVSEICGRGVPCRESLLEMVVYYHKWFRVLPLMTVVERFDSKFMISLFCNKLPWSRLLFIL